MSLAAILLAALVVGPGSVVLASFVLRLPEASLERLAPRMLSLAVGAILGMALLRMLPHALEHGSSKALMGSVLVAILLLFLLERFRILRHCHEFHCSEHADRPTRIFLGNASHGLVDGIALALAFQAGPGAGWVFALALVGHEVPKSLVNLMLLWEGRERGAALLWVLLPSLFTLLGALAVALGLTFVRSLAPYALAVGAGFFLYLALADLVPKHRRHTTRSEALWQSALVVVGVGLILLLPAHG